MSYATPPTGARTAAELIVRPSGRLPDPYEELAIAVTVSAVKEAMSPDRRRGPAVRGAGLATGRPDLLPPSARYGRRGYGAAGASLGPARQQPHRLL